MKELKTMQSIGIENQKTRAVSRNRNYWHEIITSWQKSNEHPKTFCERMNIKLGTFVHWKGVFSKENKQKENKFIEVQVTEQVQEKLAELTIECPSGHKIIFTAAVKVEQVRQLFKLLGLAR